MASKSKSKCEKPTRNWSELPSDITINILQRLGVVDRLENAQKVCTTWRKIYKDPAMWRVVHMEACLLDDPARRDAYKEMCKQAVDRSQGQLLDLTVRYGDYELLLYIANRSSQLRRLELVKFRHIFNEEWGEAFKKLPLLKELSFIETEVWDHNIEDVARYCPLLKTLKLNQKPSIISCTDDEIDYVLSMQDDTALAVGEYLCKLTNLELIGNSMTGHGLQFILRRCCHLESLDLRQCRNIWGLNGELGKRCSQQIKNLKLPWDDLKGHPYAREVLYEPEYDSDFYEHDPYDYYDDDYTTNNNDNFDNLNDVEEP